jgi:hypothetical protein
VEQETGNSRSLGRFVRQMQSQARPVSG